MVAKSYVQSGITQLGGILPKQRDLAARVVRRLAQIYPGGELSAACSVVAEGLEALHCEMSRSSGKRVRP